MALKFIYVGENERPVKILNFRKRENGGLSLFCPVLKSKSLLFRSLCKDIQYRNIQINQFSEYLYYSRADFMEFYESGNHNMSSKEIYDYLLYKYVRNNSGLIPSRIELVSILK